jgi:hypothetical protein
MTASGTQWDHSDMDGDSPVEDAYPEAAPTRVPDDLWDDNETKDSHPGSVVVNRGAW